MKSEREGRERERTSVRKREGGCESRVVVVVVVVESERWSTLKGGNKTGGGMTVSVLPLLPLQGHLE